MTSTHLQRHCERPRQAVESEPFCLHTLWCHWSQQRNNSQHSNNFKHITRYCSIILSDGLRLRFHCSSDLPFWSLQFLCLFLFLSQFRLWQLLHPRLQLTLTRGAGLFLLRKSTQNLHDQIHRDWSKYTKIALSQLSNVQNPCDIALYWLVHRHL